VPSDEIEEIEERQDSIMSDKAQMLIEEQSDKIISASSNHLSERHRKNESLVSANSYAYSYGLDQMS
jgi:hypothetical protein